jgi:hypothetical protein
MHFLDYCKLVGNLTDGSKQALVMTSYELAYVMHTLNPQNFVVLKENIITDLEAIILFHKNFLFHAYKDRSVQLLESGIVEKILSDLKPTKKLRSDDDPAVLTLEHLLIWFQLWMGFLAVSTAFFFVELVVGKFSTKQT